MSVDFTPVLRDPMRLAALARLGLLDRPALPAFDRLVQLVIRVLHVPTALVTLVDADRQFFAACRGLSEPLASQRQTPLSHSFCQYAVVFDAPLVVNDARTHPLLYDNPAINDNGVVAYAGIPLRTSDGHVLGTLCVVDSMPRTWQPYEVELLADLAATAVTELELRREIIEREQAEAALRIRERQLHAIVEYSTDAIYIKDLQGRYLLINPAGAAMAELPVAAMIGKSDAELFEPPIAQQFQTGDRHLMASGRPLTTEGLLRIGGRERVLHTTMVPYRAADDAIIGVIGIARDITARKQAEESVLRAAETRFYAVMQAANDAIVLADSAGNIIGWNHGAQATFGYSEQEMLGHPLTCLMPDRGASATLRGFMHSAADDPQHPSTTIELSGLRRDGSEFPIEMSLATWGRGHNTVYSAIIRDSSARKRLEAQFLQAQKMESIGRLAGGVAHDFNNLLTAIRGYVDLVMLALPAGSPVLSDLQEIQDAAERAAGLTRQLLTFARKQMIASQPLNLNRLIVNLDRMLRRLIGEDIELVLQLDPALTQVTADPGQIEQVIVNLVINARDAMPSGGQLAIETALTVVEPHAAGLPAEATPGRYVELTIRDTGTGITPEARAHLFEPFFTTKAPDKGTGLGLATSYGIVRQHGGFITYTSEVGLGTTFTIHLPCGIPAEVALPDAATNQSPRGDETILLVEDDATVRRFAVRVLRSYGYQVLEASDGQEAIALFERGACAQLDLLLTDLVMPRLGGQELAHWLATRTPQLRVLFASGYTEQDRLRTCDLQHASFLAKPYTPVMLLQAVRGALDAHPVEGGTTPAA